MEGGERERVNETALTLCAQIFPAYLICGGLQLEAKKYQWKRLRFFHESSIQEKIFRNPYLQKIIKIYQQFRRRISFDFIIFIHTVLRVTQLRIDNNNINTYYYKNTSKRCRSAIFKKHIRTIHTRPTYFPILCLPIFYNKPKKNVQLHRQYLRLDFVNEACAMLLLSQICVCVSFFTNGVLFYNYTKKTLFNFWQFFLISLLQNQVV